MPERRNEMDEISAAFGLAMQAGIEEDEAPAAPRPKRIVMEKAINLKNRPGLTLRAAKDPRYQRWQKNPQGKPPPKLPAGPPMGAPPGMAGGAPAGGGAAQGRGQGMAEPPPGHVGQEVSFRHPVHGAPMRGTVRSSGGKGVTIQSHSGEHYRIDHGNYLKADPNGSGPAGAPPGSQQGTDASMGQEGGAEGAQGAEGAAGGSQGGLSVGQAYQQAKGAGAAAGSDKPSGGDASPASSEGDGSTRHWIEKSPELPDDTKTAHSGPDGNYLPARKELHDKLVDGYLKDAPSVPDTETPVAIVMMGGPASGKTTGLQKLFDEGQLKKFVNVNPDAVKDQLPEFQKATGGLGKTPDGKSITAKNAAKMVHPESSDVAGRVQHAAIEQRKNMILDGTGKDQSKMEQKIKGLKDAGYSVHLVMVHLDKDEAQKRQAVRAERTGRHVPDDVFHGAHDAIPQNFEPLSKQAHEATLIDNTGPKPQQVMKRGMNGTEVNDADRWQGFQAHAQALRQQHGSGEGLAGGETEDAPRQAPVGGPGPGDPSAHGSDGGGSGPGAGDAGSGPGRPGPGQAGPGPAVGKHMEKAARLVAGLGTLIDGLRVRVVRRALEKGVTPASLGGVVPEDLEGSRRRDEDDDDEEELHRAEVHGWVDDERGDRS